MRTRQIQIIAASLFMCSGLCQTVASQSTTPAQGKVASSTPAPAVAWKFATKAPIVSSPVINGNIVYFGGYDSAFYAVNLATGKLIWKVVTGGQIRSTAVVVNGIVYFYSGDGILRAAKAESGGTIWTFACESEGEHDFADYYQSSPTISDSLLYFGSGDKHIYALRADDGTLLWKFLTGDVVHATPAVDSTTVFVGSFDGYFYALKKFTGELAWKFKSVGHDYFPKGDFSGSPIIYGDMVFVGARDYNFYALDKAKGYCHWNKSFSRGWALPAVIHDTTLYIGTSDDRVLLAVDPTSGREFWKTNLHFNIFGGLAIDSSTGFVGTLLGKVYGLDLRTGAILWSFATDGYTQNHLRYFKPDDSFRDDIFEIVPSNEAFVEVEHQIGAIFSTPAISGNNLVVTSTDGTVYCLRR